MSQKCHHCQTTNPDEANYCASCGKPIGTYPCDYTVVQSDEYNQYKEVYEFFNRPENTYGSLLNKFVYLILKKYDNINKRVYEKSHFSLEGWIFTILFSLLVIVTFFWMLNDFSIVSTLCFVISLGIPLGFFYLSSL